MCLAEPTEADWFSGSATLLRHLAKHVHVGIHGFFGFWRHFSVFGFLTSGNEKNRENLEKTWEKNTGSPATNIFEQTTYHTTSPQCISMHVTKNCVMPPLSQCYNRFACEIRGKKHSEENVNRQHPRFKKIRCLARSLVCGTPNSPSQMTHVWNSCLQIWVKLMVNVNKYSIHAESEHGCTASPLFRFSAPCLRRLWRVLPSWGQVLRRAARSAHLFADDNDEVNTNQGVATTLRTQTSNFPIIADASALHLRHFLTATWPAAFVVSQRLSPAASSTKSAGLTVF